MQVDSITSLAGALAYGSSETGTARGNSTTPGSAQPSANPEVQSTKPDQGKQNLDQVINSIKDAIKGSNIELEFSKDADSGAIVVKWVDSVSGEAINQIPSETALHLAAALGKLQGQLFNKTA